MATSKQSPAAASAAKAAKPVNWTLWISLALIAATVGLYAPAVHFDFVTIDDAEYSTANSHIAAGLTRDGMAWAFTSSVDANWFPLTVISHMLDRQLFGWNPGPRHAVNLALHTLSTLLLFLVMSRLTKRVWPSGFIALAFALHPLHVESVAWIAERKDVLCAVFFLAAIWVYASYVAKPAPWRYVLILIAFGCALMSKPMAVTLPFVLLLLDFWPLERFSKESVTRLIVEKIPLALLSLGSAIITFLVQRGAGAVVGGDLVPLGMRLENAILSCGTYLLQFVWPAKLAVFYPYAEIPVWQAILAALVVIAISWLAITQRRERPYLLTGWLWFLGMLIPVIGIVQVGLQAHADRYMYLPSIGLSIMLAFGAADLLAQRTSLQPAVAIAGAALCVGWGLVTWNDLEYWRESRALYQHALEVTQNNYIAENGLGEVLLRQGQSADAVPHLLRVIDREPWFSGGRINLGAAFSKMGRPRDAEEQYRHAIRLDPESAEAHCGLGVALGELGRSDEAIPQLYEALRIRPDYADAHYNLGRVLALQGRTPEAMTQFAETVRLQPANPEAHYNLGTALASMNRMKESAAEFRTAIDLNPDYLNARFNYASALANLEQFDESIAQFNELLKRAPDFPHAQESLAQAVDMKNDSRK